MKKEIERFFARAEDGERFELIVTQDSLESPTAEGPQSIPGVKAVRTVDGQRVNVINWPNEFQVLKGPKVKRA